MSRNGAIIDLRPSFAAPENGEESCIDRLLGLMIVQLC
jgi:hypothetical protein